MAPEIIKAMQLSGIEP